MTQHDPDEPAGAGFMSRATGWALVGIGSLCVAAGVVAPFVFDVSDPTGPAIGASGLRFGGVFFCILGAYLVLAAPTDS